ncbi:MAG: hypothetical protein EXR21_04550 [Flavobacteriaceae bacterium]|nr:hypothetical protein [Flavobacteriaceae bacterium]
MANQEILIYVSRPGPRHSYVFRELLGGLQGLRFEITHDDNKYKSATIPRLNYSSKELPGLQVVPFSDSNLPSWDVRPEELFQSNDLIAKSFYLLSRAEEYGDFEPDAHGRFQAEHSILYRLGLHRKPVVNIWVNELKEELKKVYPTLQFAERKFTALATIDIDSAWCFGQKGLARQMGGFVGDILKLQARRLLKRIEVWTGAKDPFDIYDEVCEMHQSRHIPLHFFWLLANRGKHDKNIHWKNERQQIRIKQLAEKHGMGIHPSYHSLTDPQLMAEEISRLNDILKSLERKKVETSRQHFLRLAWPTTFRQLLRLDIREDYSLGWASQVGFRAGICTPFTWYDLRAEEETHLTLVPFACMDVTLKTYMQQSPEEALQTCKELIDETAAVGGQFVSLWHNESLSGFGQWRGWPQRYHELLDYIRLALDKN